MHKPPTVSDIAEAASVSPSTVSRVLTGNSPVHPEKRAAVLAAIKQLNFRPNLNARALVRGKSMAIGILTQSMASQFYGELAQGIEEGLAGSGYHPIFASGQWRRDEELAALTMLVDRQVDALIVLGGSQSNVDLSAISAQIPVITVGRTMPGDERQCLRVQNYEGARSATRHLIDLGHRRIAHITGIPAHNDARERRRGYEDALAEARLPVDERLIAEGDFTEQSGLLALESLVARGASFSAIFAANDQIAYGARLGLSRRGLRVPEDVSLVGFDDLLTSAYMTPPLTTVRQNMLEQGRSAARATLRLLAGEEPDLAPAATELVVRESTARLRG
ncbi:substrate-binding domain-containing protein [Oscillochloris sp. ZM17-4]|uniref:LacI family DNA-binding transcriptional regulator n=1 Tax=Oscillochloris sp. ZM17-4 TaxID=2866714 RepID=UPI001C738797|nr:substrate-binding domain-containing protein [Oscillochloris sp. ZM17-4]MBX0331001.1 substrate-binding domain-containing protein [Oscillochloris sp. ZM17-4]